MSEFYVYDTNRTFLGPLEEYESIQWLDHYQDAGEVAIVAGITERNRELLVEGHRIFNTDELTVAKILEVELQTANPEDGGIPRIIARCALTSRLLDDRVVMATENVINVEEAMYSIYTKNRRALPIGVAAAKGYGERTSMEITWHSVLDAEKTLAQTSGMGFRVTFDPETATETFEVYRGTDRTAYDDYVGHIGTDVDNLAGLQYITGSFDFKNVAIVAGEDSGTSRKVRTVSLGTVSGEDRRELYVDARDLQSEYQVATPTGEKDSNGNPMYSYEQKTYSAAEYNTMLDTRGYEKLAEQLRTLSIECSVSQRSIVYGIDYSLGDRMPIRVPEFDLELSAVIMSVQRNYSLEEDNTISVTLGDFQVRTTYGAPWKWLDGLKKTWNGWEALRYTWAEFEHTRY